MQKIISLFQRNYDTDRLVRDELVPGAEWVADGEGIATRKFDGTCCRIENGEVWRRYDVKKGRTQPPGFVRAMDPDPVTGHFCGWVPCSRAHPEDRYHFEAFDTQTRAAIHLGFAGLADGTWELCGPKVQSNPEHFDEHLFVKHGTYKLEEAPRTYDKLRLYFEHMEPDIEGIVWHHPDGRMVKIKARDFGLKRTPDADRTAATRGKDS